MSRWQVHVVLPACLEIVQAIALCPVWLSNSMGVPNYASYSHLISRQNTAPTNYCLKIYPLCSHYAPPKTHRLCPEQCRCNSRIPNWYAVIASLLACRWVSIHVLTSVLHKFSPSRLNPFVTARSYLFWMLANTLSLTILVGCSGTVFDTIQCCKKNGWLSCWLNKESSRKVRHGSLMFEGEGMHCDLVAFHVLTRGWGMQYSLHIFDWDCSNALIGIFS